LVKGYIFFHTKSGIYVLYKFCFRKKESEIPEIKNDFANYAAKSLYTYYNS